MRVEYNGTSVSDILKLYRQHPASDAGMDRVVRRRDEEIGRSLNLYPKG